ncbi:transmembrane reductase CYB561D2-like isoform X1 [Choristoneura fumiferana]|uniref:transmembrane reductase CYB561D2-like isoform X1 n=1 Tax=Choristoneura fumiferana TaxID=7141 RepID=UPI003D158142
MFEMADNIDQAPIVDEMVTEHEVVPEVPSAVDTTEMSVPWTIRSLGVSWDAVHASLNTLVYMLLGGSALVTLWFACKSPSEMTAFHWHIVFCMIGYQLLMPHGLLCLQSFSWSSPLTFSQRRRAHWLLSLVGSILALIGSALMGARKTDNSYSLHGKFAIAALVFTIVSLAKGVLALYPRLFRRYNAFYSIKISHSLLGTTAFILSSGSLSYGYLKHSFTGWATVQFSYTMVSLTCISTLLVILAPTYKLSRKLFNIVKRKFF